MDVHTNNDGSDVPDVDLLDIEAVNKKETRDLYQSRIKIFPSRVKGTFRNLKWWIMGITLGIYYLTPWIRWDRGPHAPDQAVLVDIANRRFYFFSIEIWPQEFFYVAGLLIMSGIGLFILTSIVGRAWCGYMCPQTVWVDLFLVVERWIDGDRNAQIKLDKAPWTFNKLAKTFSKYSIWMLIAIATGGAWIFYFADAPSLARDFLYLQADPVAYYTVGILTMTTFVLAGFMREQVCTYMCPWPRIQGAMLDEDSLVVTYNDWRGEPRSKHAKKLAEAGERPGDCIDCNQCVAVCPMGIDIRDGEQLECITCALCIDACDAVMDKVKKPRGLIAYSTLNGYNQAKEGHPELLGLHHFIRPRTIIYCSIWSLAGFAMLFALLMRDRLDLNVLHDRNPLYVQLSDGSIRNGYTVKILNMKPEPRSFRLKLEGLPAAQMSLAGTNDGKQKELIIPVDPDRVKSMKIYISAPKASLHEPHTSFRFLVSEIGGEEREDYRAIFESPK